jgi:hypothetical protein
MSRVTIVYDYYGHEIKQSVDLVELVSQLNPAQKISTVIELINAIDLKQNLEPFQIAILKQKAVEIKKIFEI